MKTQKGNAAWAKLRRQQQRATNVYLNIDSPALTAGIERAGAAVEAFGRKLVTPEVATARKAVHARDKRRAQRKRERQARRGSR